MNDKKKNPNAVALGSLGGKSRANKLSKLQRQVVAKRAGIISGIVRSKRHYPEPINLDELAEVASEQDDVEPDRS